MKQNGDSQHYWMKLIGALIGAVIHSIVACLIVALILLSHNTLTTSASQFITSAAVCGTIPGAATGYIVAIRRTHDYKGAGLVSIFVGVLYMLAMGIILGMAYEHKSLDQIQTGKIDPRLQGAVMLGFSLIWSLGLIAWGFQLMLYNKRSHSTS